MNIYEDLDLVAAAEAVAATAMILSNYYEHSTPKQLLPLAWLSLHQPPCVVALGPTAEIASC